MADSRRGTVGLAVLCFAFLFAPRLAVGVNLAAAAVAMLLAWRWRDVGSAMRSPDIRLSAVAVVAVMAYNLVLARIYDNDPNYVARILISLPIYLVFGFVFARAVRELQGTSKPVELVWEVARIAMMASVVNAVVVLLQSAFPPFKAATEALLMQGISNIDYASHPFSSRGLTAAGGAGLSVMLAIAVWIAAAMTLVGRLSATKGVSAMLLLTTANVFVGRTGLIVAVGAFALYVVAQSWLGLRSRGRSRRQVAFVLALVAIAPVVVLRFVALDSEVLLWAFEWLGTSGEGFGKSDSTDHLRGMLFIPSTAAHLTTGVGFFEGTSLQYDRTDAGYLKTIFTLGVPIASAVYLAISGLWLRLMARHYLLVLLLGPILAVLLLVEIKEPFLYQNYAGRFVFLMIGVSFALSSNDALSRRRSAGPTLASLV